METIKKLGSKYREQISYLFFGGLTTVINWGVYHLLITSGVANVPSVAVSQILSILFAYVTNKLFVFRSKADGVKGLLREMGSFFACRGLSFFLDIVIMWVTVDKLGFNNDLMKLLSNVVIVIVNYAASKLWIFGKSGGEK